MNKKNLALFAGVLVTGALIGGSTLAYFTDQDVKTNTFTVGALDIEEVEPDWNDDTDGKKLIPGSIRFKNPTIRNKTSEEKGSNACYCRIVVDLKEGGQSITNAERLEKIWTIIRYDETYSWDNQTNEGTSVQLTEGNNSGLLLREIQAMPQVNPLFTLAGSEPSMGRKIFNYTGNGGILPAGGEAVLFTTVAVPKDWTQEDLDEIGSFDMVVTAQAIQASGFENAESALSALAAAT